MVPFDPNASWWLKIARAKLHLKDFNDLLDGARDPHLTVVRVEKDFQRGEWIYTAHHDWAVPVMLPLVLGDFLFNLRSALDHIAAANATGIVNAQSYFPIFTKDPRIAHGKDAKTNARWLDGWKKFQGRTLPAVYAVIEAMQPFQAALQNGGDPDNEALAILDRLQQADKHKSLNVIDQGIGDVAGFIIQKDGARVTIDGEFPVDGMFPNGARFLSLPEEMDVELFGVVKVAVTGGLETTYREVPRSLADLLDSVVYFLRVIETAMQPVHPSVPPDGGTS